MAGKCFRWGGVNGRKKRLLTHQQHTQTRRGVIFERHRTLDGRGHR
jgi:hypothetical protein